MTTIRPDSAMPTSDPNLRRASSTQTSGPNSSKLPGPSEYGPGHEAGRGRRCLALESPGIPVLHPGGRNRDAKEKNPAGD